MNENEEESSGDLIRNNTFMFALKTDQEIKDYLASEEENKLGNKLINFKDSENTSGSEIDTNYPIETQTKSLYQRLFGRIDAGSIRGSIFNLAILSLGSGCLALPQKFGQMSILVSLIDIILAGLAAYWTLNLMIIASEKYKIYNYSELVNHLYGRGLSLVLDITMLVYIFGVMILYQVIGK
jgi:hypothetical protein